MFAKQQQLLNAAHGPGQYVRDSGECAVCHTHRDFIERLSTGAWAYSAGSVDDVVPMSCRTCHQIHTRCTPLCASCHQSRIRSPMPVPGGDDVTFTHHGPHGSTQGDMNAGVGFFLAGRAGGPHAHQTDARSRGCAMCHMAVGSQTVGGHTFEMGNNQNACQICHDMTGVEGFDKFRIQTDVKALLDELAPLLDENGAGIAHWDAGDEEWHPVPGTYSTEDGALPHVGRDPRRRSPPCCTGGLAGSRPADGP